MSTPVSPHVSDLSAWTSAGLGGKAALAFDLAPRHTQAFARAIESVRSRGLGLFEVTRDDFPLAEIAADVAELKRRLDQGHGLVVARGFPVGDWPAEDVELMYWGLGTHLGTAASQSVMGDRLGHVVDVSDEDENARAYRSRGEMPLHHDFGNYHGMLSIGAPRRGGQSRFASAIAVHNRMLEEAPELLPPLYHGYSLYRIGEQGPGELPYTAHRVPVFSTCEGYLSSRFMRAFIEAAATLREEPLTDRDVAAFDCFEAISRREEVMVEFSLEPGEAAFYNNLFVMHARAAFEDDKPNDIRRHLLRLWLYTDDGRPVVSEIEVFDAPGIPPQPGQSPSGEGEVLRKLGAKRFSRAAPDS